MADVTWAGTLRRRKKKLADLSGVVPKDEGTQDFATLLNIL